MRKKKKLEYEVDANGCHNITSHCCEPNGYPRITINGVRDRAHRHIVREKLLDGKPIPSGMVIRHRCDNKKCINPDHFIVGTQKENVNDMIERNLFPMGISHGNSKLKEVEVIEIIASTKPSNVLAKKFQINPSVVCKIKKGKAWKHLSRKNMCVCEA